MKVIKKAIDFPNSNVRVDDLEQAAAMKVAPKQLVSMLKSSTKNLGQFEVCTCEIETGTVFLTKKEEGLYQGVFKSQDGVVKALFDNATMEMVARDLLVKGFYNEEEKESEEEESEGKTHIKIKFGEFEFELKKSLLNIQEAVNGEDLRKALSSWKTSIRSTKLLKSDKAALEELLTNWDLHKESFNQILFGLQQER